MRRINENDMSRIIKKVLRESEKSDGVGACFKVARIPAPEACQNMLGYIDPRCLAKLTTLMVTNPTAMNITKIGTLCVCIGALTAEEINRFIVTPVKPGRYTSTNLNK